MENERVYIEVNLDNMAYNVELVRKKCPGSLIMAVLKADAYGHGAVEVAKFLRDKVDYFGVAVIDEGIQLRKAGVTKPVLIFGNTVESRYFELIKYDIMPTVYAFSSAEAMSLAAKKEGKTLKIHIAVDTGMSRLGFLPSEYPEVLKISKLMNIKIEGLFTHYACADEKSKRYSELQRKRFIDFLSRLSENGVSAPVRHISNSAGIIETDGSLFNMVRMGIMLYGLYPSREVDLDFGLKPVMSFYTRVVQVKTFGQGRGVSYGATFVTLKDTKIATLSAGYADGYPRALSSKGRVLINGSYAPVIGRVCMDLMMADVSGIEDVKAGDRAVLVGEDGGNRITVEELAEKAGSFNYELICGIGLRVSRLYIKDGKPYKKVNYLEK